MTNISLIVVFFNKFAYIQNILISPETGDEKEKKLNKKLTHTYLAITEFSNILKLVHYD